MKLEEANIFGFGRLENFKINFSPRITIIYGNNETGKSTLQTFIWGMLYGLVNPDIPQRRKLPEFDKFFPWNDKIGFGGILKYTLDSGQKIEVHRSFEPHRLEIRDGVSGKDISSSFPIMKNKESLFAIEHLGLSHREFLNTVFIRQLKIHEFEENDQTHISARLISLAETGDEELSIKKAIERIDYTISSKIGVEHSNAVKPLRQAINQKEEIEKKLKKAENDHIQTLELMTHLKEIKYVLLDREKDGKIFEEYFKKYKFRRLNEKLTAISALEKTLEDTEQELANVKNYVEFPEDEITTVRELYPGSKGLILEIYKLKEKIKQLDAKKNPYENKLKMYQNFDRLERDILDKLSGMESDKNAAHYNLLKEETSLSSFRQELNKITKTINEFHANVPQLDSTLMEHIHEKKILEANLAFQEKDIENIKEEIKKEEENKISLVKTCRTKKIIGFILCFTVIGAILGIPLLFQIKKIRQNLNVLEQKIIQLNEKLRFAGEKFDTDNKNYQQIHKLQIIVQEKLGVSNWIELKNKYDEIVKMGNLKSVTEEKIRDTEKRIFEYNNILTELNNQSKIILQEFGLVDFKSCKEKFKEYSEFFQIVNRINEESKINQKIIEEKEKNRIDIENKLNKIFSHAGVKDYDEFHLHFNEIQIYRRLCEKKQEIKEKIDLLLEGKSVPELKKDFDELKNKINFEERDQLPSNISIDELKIRDRKNSAEIQNINNEMIQLETKLEYLDKTSDSISELEIEIEECEEKIKYFKIEKIALEAARKNIEEIAENFHSTKFMPELRQMVTPFLKKITGKYEEIFVDEKLNVRVRIPDLNKVVDIGKLSVGSCEQIYFIFKTAIGKMLTKNKEKVPLIFDDIFVNFDFARRNRAWDTLFLLSEENQIILFTCHEQYKDEWEKILEHEKIKYKKEFLPPEFNVIST